MASSYERIAQMAEVTNSQARSGEVVIKGSSLRWESGHHGRHAFISEPGLLDSSVQTMSMFLEELPPGGCNGRHRHFNEALIYILEGRGYSIVDGERYDWEAGDVVSVPLNKWHQHFNADSERRVLYLGCTNQPLLRAMGLNTMEDDHEHQASGHGHGGHNGGARRSGNT
jgi:gentisate 1,2-dioxygenase